MRSNYAREISCLQVIIRTSDIKGAGTDANVTICIFGSKDGQTLDSGTRKLDDSANNFERNMVDNFMIKCQDLGELTRVTVSTRGLGIGSSETWSLTCSPSHACERMHFCEKSTGNCSFSMT